MRHVPGKTEERPLEEQADKLVEKLTGHSVFARTRGNVRGFPWWELLDLDSDISPTKSLREFDKYMADLRVMRHLVVWLRYHGYRRAAEELQHALSDPEYRMWCEDVPLHESRVGTVVMFDPVATMRIFRWWPDGQYHLPQWSSLGEQISAESKSLLASYPTLSRGEREVQPFLALRRDVINPMLAAANAKARDAFAGISWTGPHFPLYTGDGCKKPNERKSYEDGAWAYLFTGYEQGEMLSWFPRELQSRLATWQVQVPLSHLQGVPMVKCRIGFYPETEHSRWQKLCASRASRGVSAEMGVVIEPHEDCESEGRFTLQSYTWR